MKKIIYSKNITKGRKTKCHNLYILVSKVYDEVIKKKQDA